MTDGQLICDVFREVKGCFIWHSDQAQHGICEHWTSYADDVDDGVVFRDDCDAFALTCAELLVRAGITTDRVAVVTCTDAKAQGHAVCRVDDYVLDNQCRGVRHISSLPYQWRSSMSLAEPGIWRDLTQTGET